MSSVSMLRNLRAEGSASTRMCSLARWEAINTYVQPAEMGSQARSQPSYRPRWCRLHACIESSSFSTVVAQAREFRGGPMQMVVPVSAGCYIVRSEIATVQPPSEACSGGNWQAR